MKEGTLERTKGILKDPIRNVDVIALVGMVCITIALYSGKLDSSTYKELMGTLIGVLVGARAKNA